MLKPGSQYAPLAPLMALSGVFVHPLASTALPLILFFIFNWQNMLFAKRVALRAADLAFSIQLFLILASALLAAYLAYQPMPAQQARAIMSNITLVAVIYLIASLVIGAIQAFRGKEFTYVLSLKIAERLFQATGKG